MSYYDLDDILADAEKLPCQFNYTIPGLGYLEGNPGKSIKKGTKIELPFWLAEILAILEIDDDNNKNQNLINDDNQEKLNFITLDDPEFINEKVINAIKSNSESLNLNKLSSQYYEMIIKWLNLIYEPKLIEVIMNCLKQRSFKINNFSNNINQKHFNNEFLYYLDEFEKKLFRDSIESNKLMKNWLKE
ncbi:PSF3 [Candida pseudojiufengensis]|uniref:PSF3 n=1 Tax=Candida pseudojiufengensis TaxID=497109 RepID=UPI002224461B|nr:PSF3 [Candida pseudojiufengensis]KAI5960734.1 PSF3 [Candida pseudojiufengensis]